MTGNDWYRNTSWNAKVEAYFEQRLRRAHDKAQFLRIQASHLAEIHPTVALGLLQRYFVLGEHFDIAQAHVDRAQALIALGDIDGALCSYEAALQRERDSPKLQTLAYLDLPCLVLDAGWEHMYVRALDVLNTHRDQPMFPVDRYRAHGARALLLHHFGRKNEARVEAASAMAAASETQSGFRYHPNVGLVRDNDDWFGARVAALSSDNLRPF